MDAHRRGLGLAGAGEHLALHVEDQQARRRDLRPVPAVAVHQEGSARPRHQQAEMVVDAFMQAEADRQPKGGGQLLAGFAQRVMCHEWAPGSNGDTIVKRARG